MTAVRSNRNRGGRNARGCTYKKRKKKDIGSTNWILPPIQLQPDTRISSHSINSGINIACFQVITVRNFNLQYDGTNKYLRTLCGSHCIKVDKCFTYFIIIVSVPC